MNTDSPQWEIFIHGTPASGGSKTFFPIWHADKKTLRIVYKNGRQWPIINVTDDAGERNKQWRRDVAIQAKKLMIGSKPFDVPFHCHFTFFLRRPQCHYGTGRNAEILKPGAPKYHTIAPDSLKLARSTEDALTGIVWVDDAQVVLQTAEKRYAEIGQDTGCIIRLKAILPIRTTEPTLL